MRYIADIASNWKQFNTEDFEDPFEADIRNFEYVKRCIDTLEELGVEYVKFQLWQCHAFIHRDHPSWDTFQNLEMPGTMIVDIVEYIKTKKIKPMFTCFDSESVELVNLLGVRDWKIASSDFTYKPLINQILDTCPENLFISTGNATETEITDIIRYIGIRKNPKTQVVIMHCIPEYPTQIKNLGFGRFKWLSYMYPHYRLGWSSHVKPKSAAKVAGLASTLGAKYTEFHFKMSEADTDTPDKPVSLTPKYVKEVREYQNYIDEVMELPRILEEEKMWSTRNKDGVRPSHF